MKAGNRNWIWAVLGMLAIFLMVQFLGRESDAAQESTRTLQASENPN